MAAQDLAIKLSISADTAEGKAALQAFAEQMGQIQPEAERASDGIKSAFQQMREDLNTALTFSAGELIADSLKSGIDAVKQFGADSIAEFRAFEDAMTGVAKTTGIPKEAAADLAEALRQSAIDLKGLGEGAATQMASIAEIAGQLGVAQDKIEAGKFKEASDEIAGFSEIIAKSKISLKEFSGGAEEVATKTAQIINLYQKTSSEAENILSVYNGLGDTLETDANKISNFMASFTMAPQLKISFEEAAAIGATLTALGQDAGAAATNYQGAISQILAGSERSVDALTTALKGSSAAQHQLEGLLGRSKGATENFYNYFKEALAVDAVAATNALIDAIGAMPDSVTQTQTSLDVFGREGARVMNALIGNTNSLNENIAKAKTLYKENTSIQAEFERAISKQGTAFDELKTKIADVKIEVGEHLVAALGEAAKSDISPAIDQFSNWLKTSQDAKALFENLPVVINGLAAAAVGAGKLAVGAYNAIKEAADWWGKALVDVEAQIRKVIAAIGDTVEKAKKLSNAVFQNETVIGLFQGITDSIYGVDAAQQDLTVSVRETTEAIAEEGDVAYGKSTYPDMTEAIGVTQEAQRGLTEDVAVTTEQVGVLGEQALATFSEFASAMEGIGSNLGSLGGSLGDLGGILGIKELGGLSGILGKAEEIAGIPSILGDIGGSLGGLMDSAGSLGGLLGGGGLTGIVSSLGSSLSGGLGSAVSSVSGLLSGGLGSAVSAVSGAIGGLGSTIMGGLGSAVSSVSGLFGSLGGAATGLLGALGPIGLAGGAIALAWEPLKGLFSSIFGEAQSEGNKANEVWRNYVGDVIDSSGQMEQALVNAYKTFSASGNDYLTFLNNAGPATRALHDELGGLNGVTLSGLVGAMEAAGVSSEKSAQVALQQVAAFAELGYSAEEASAKIGEMIAATEGAGKEGESTTSVFDDQTSKAQALGAEIETLSGSLGDVTDELSGTGKTGSQTGTVFDTAGDKADGLEGRIENLSGSLEDVTDELSGTGKEGGQTGAVFDTAGAKAQGLENRIENLSSSLGDVTSELAGTGSTGRDTGAVFEIAADAAQGLDHTVSGLSHEVSDLTHDMSETGVKALASSNMFQVAGRSADGLSSDVDGLSSQAAAAWRTLEDVNDVLDSIPNEKKLTFVIEQEGDIPALAAGGDIGLSGLAWVNERGPEIAEFPGGSMALLTAPGPVLAAFPVGTEIIPHSRSMEILRSNPAIPRMAEGGTILGTAALSIGAIEIHNHFAEAPTSANLDRLTEQMSRTLAQKIRRML